jgi:hypothetical protein
MVVGLICIAAWLTCITAWLIYCFSYLQLFQIVQDLLDQQSPCFECLNESISLLELIRDGNRSWKQSIESEDIRIFLWKDLKSAAVTIDGKNDWELVISEGGETLIKVLWDTGVDLKRLDDNGKTILHLAVEKNNMPVVLLLWKLGFDMTAKNSAGQTALEVAEEPGMKEILKLLL